MRRNEDFRNPEQVQFDIIIDFHIPEIHKETAGLSVIGLLIHFNRGQLHVP